MTLFPALSKGEGNYEKQLLLTTNNKTNEASQKRRLVCFI